MIDVLQEIFNEVAQLPEDEQLHIAEIIRQEIASEHHWQTLFHNPQSECLLEKLMNEDLTEDAFGETKEIIGDDFLS